MMAHDMDELNALLEERARYEKWLAQLGARREQTPAHVFERVRADYSGRLAAVMDQLRDRAEGLQVSAAALEERSNALATDEESRRDARAEIELRSLVGEYSTDQAERELAACDQDIARLASERAAVNDELGRIQEILRLVRQPEPKTPVAPTWRPLGAPPSNPESEAAYEELAFLNSVVESPSAPAPAAPKPEAVPLVTSLAPPKPSGAQPAVRDSAARGSGTPASTPTFLKDMPTEQVKTLKCQECGTMNYPTEWYCERCGGELAAM